MATFSDPPLSQSSDVSIPHLFSTPAGSQMQVFLDPGGILGRPKLVRLLKKSGAFICSDPKHAQVILVDSSSDTGRQFIRDWGLDQNKVVLEYTWVTKSIAARKLLQENDEWGGCGTYDDGLPIGRPIKDVMDEIPKSPLPTPRITPIEPSQPSRSRERSLAESSSHRGSDRPLHHSPSAESAPPYYLDSTTNGLSSYPQSSLPRHGQANMISQFPLSQSSDPNLQQFAHLQPPQANAIQQLLQSQSGQGGAQMFMNSTGQHNSQVSEQSFAMSLLDIMKSYGIDPWSVTQSQIIQNNTTQLPFFAQQYANSLMQPSQDQQAFPLPHSTNSNTNPFHSPPSSEPSIAPSSPRSRMLPPSLRRKSPPPSPPSTSFHSHSKGKGRTVSQSHSNQRSSYTDNDPSPSPYPVGVSPSQHAQTGKIFTSKTGKELAFFVQIDLNNRLAVVNNIKKHGGKITNSHTVADYSILYSRSKTFPDLLKSTIAAEKPAVTASFVHDSVAENTLKDPEDYLFDVPATMKRKRPRFTPLSEEQQEAKAERRREERNRRQAERRKIAKGGNTQQQYALVNEENEEGERLQCEMGSPSPPPNSARVQLTGGKYQFSESEREYLTRYVRFLLEQDHLISNTCISHKLFSKMPNHSQRSWLAFISNVVRDEIEALRKKAGIAHRKAESADLARQERERHQLGDRGDAGPSKRMKLTSSPLNEPESADRNLEEDFNVICQFFTTDSPEDENEDPEVTFDRLTTQAKCKSARTWIKFYNKHHAEVKERFYKLTDFTMEDVSAGPDDNL